jgi:hypothetical protein
MPLESARVSVVLPTSRRKTMRAQGDLQAEPGDVLVIHGHTTGDHGRTGVILEVLDRASGHEHYRVRWDEEHESLFWPASDASLVPGTRRKRRVSKDRS